MKLVESKEYPGMWHIQKGSKKKPGKISENFWNLSRAHDIMKNYRLHSIWDASESHREAHPCVISDTPLPL